MSDPFLLKVTIIVGSGGLIFGYDIGVISGTLATLRNEFHLDSYSEGLVVSILYAGSIIGCLFGGPLCDVLGRWRTIQVQNAIFIIGALVTGLATDLATLCAGRFLVGVASSISGLADVPYLTEIAPAEYRGVLSGQYEILVALGILVSFCLDLAFSTFSGGWRVAFLVPAGLALLQSAGLFLLPESPKWLMAKGHLNTARSALVEIYGETRMQAWIEQPLREDQDGIITTPFDVRSHSSPQSTKPVYSALQSPPEEDTDVEIHLHPGTDRDIAETSLSDPATHIPADVREYIVLRQLRESAPSTYKSPSDQLETQAAMRISTSTALTSSKDDIHNRKNLCIESSPETNCWQMWCSITPLEKELLQTYQYPIYLVIWLQFIAQITGANVVRNYAPTIFEESGASTQLSLVLNIVLGVVKLFFTTVAVFRIEEQGRRLFFLVGIAVVCGGLTFLTIASAVSHAGNLHDATLFILGCAAIYAGFGFGYGPVPWILSSEMVPPLIRARVMSWSLIASNLAQLIANALFLPMVAALSTTGAFGVFLLLNLLAGLYVYVFVVETRHLSPVQILRALQARYEQKMRCFAHSQ